MRWAGLILLIWSPCLALAAEPRVVLAVHGGAGALPRAEMSAEREAGLRSDMRRALQHGHEVLDAGGSALDTVTAVVVVLEDSPWFNAGRGAVLNANGQAELDASIMRGQDRGAGAVAALTTIKNPILAARAVMERSDNVMLAGAGAEAFALAKGLTQVDPEYFITPLREAELERARVSAGAGAASTTPAARSSSRIGTVGAVALDGNGHLAAATSTGGRTNKRWGRIGDAPIIGAGTWADAGCAVSSTGWGEYFIRLAVAHEICARQRLRGDPLDAAAKAVLDEVKAAGGDGGVIALDAQGRASLPYNTAGMVRGTLDEHGEIEIAIWED